MTIDILGMDAERAYPPRVTEFTHRFWSSLASGRLETTRCDACNLLTFPPRPYCPHCWHRATSWTQLSGKGTLYSQTRIHAVPAIFQGEPLPMHVGIADLAEGLRVAARVIAEEPLEIGADIELIALSFKDGPLLGMRSPETQ